MKVVEGVLEINFSNTSRNREMTDARIIVARFARKYNITFAAIGDALGKSHCSVIHYEKKFDDHIKFDRLFRVKYENCMAAMAKTYDPVYLELLEKRSGLIEAINKIDTELGL